MCKHIDFCLPTTFFEKYAVQTSINGLWGMGTVLVQKIIFCAKISQYPHYTYFLQEESTHFGQRVSTHFNLEVLAQFGPKIIQEKSSVFLDFLELYQLLIHNFLCQTGP